MRAVLAIVTAFALVLPRAVAQQALPDLGDVSQAGFTPAMERRVGELAMRELRRDPAFLDDVEVRSYVQALGSRLVAASPEPTQEFTFFVLRDPTVNAFAMPGGFVAVHTGLLLAAQSESELASVLAHEIAHVTQHHIARQMAKAEQIQPLAIAGMILAILAARANPQAAQAALLTSQAGATQAMLAYSRDFEREADRVGFQILKGAGFDVSGMPAFFERLQRATRLYENNAPAYLRTHPVTTERIADMQARVQGVPYRQRPDAPEFQLVRAKLRAANGTPEQAAGYFGDLLHDHRYANEAAARYGHARALLRMRDVAGAAKEVAALRKLPDRSPMIDTLDAEVKSAAGDLEGARAVLAAARVTYPGNLALAYAYAETLQAMQRHTEAIAVLDELARDYPHVARVRALAAKSYAALGKRFAQHRAQAEFYALQGSLPAAIEQLDLARAAGDGDFYSLSAAEARQRELKAKLAEEMRDERKQQYTGVAGRFDSH